MFKRNFICCSYCLHSVGKGFADSLKQAAQSTIIKRTKMRFFCKKKRSWKKERSYCDEFIYVHSNADNDESAKKSIKNLENTIKNKKKLRLI